MQPFRHKTKVKVRFAKRLEQIRKVAALHLIYDNRSTLHSRRIQHP